MADPPAVDGRRREAIRSHLESIAPYYTTEWDPTTQGPGSTLTALFSEMAEDVIERLDRVPEKHQRAFFDTLGFDRKPPYPATVPVSFSVDGGAPRNVVVDGGTRTVAPVSNGRPEQTFTVPDEQRFEATPASLQAVYGVDPSVDRVCNHWNPGSGDGLATGGDQQLFVDENEQRHVLYVGDADQLTIEHPENDGLATIRVRLTTDADQDLVESLYWQYHGEASVDSETVEQWHDATAISSVEADAGASEDDGSGSDADSDKIVFDLVFTGSLTETAVAGVESLWIRALVPSVHGRDDLTAITIDSEVRVGPGPVWTSDDGSGGDDGGGGGAALPTTKTMSPDRLLYDDVPLPFDESGAGNADEVEDVGTYHPLGTEPQQQSTFYVAAAEAFSKAGSDLVLTFAELELPAAKPVNEREQPLKDVLDGKDTDVWVRNEMEPQLSWEYWDGDGWSRIEGFTDQTGNLTGTGETVGFRVPEDLSKTTVAGHETHWIRCRLVGGSYGKWVSTRGSPASETHHVVFPPRFDYLTIEYGRQEPTEGENGENEENTGEEADESSALPSSPATQVRTENHLSDSGNLVETSSGAMRPFRPLPDAGQTLYFGFDAPLHDGPLTLFVDVSDQSFPPDFFPRIRWEYCADGDDWVELDVRDGSENLTERGIVRLVLPGESARHERFGAERHWLRARVQDDQFETSRAEMQFLPRYLLLDSDFTLAQDPSLINYRDEYGVITPGTYEVEYQDESVIRPPDSYEFEYHDESVTSDSNTFDFFTDGGCESAEPCGRTLPTEPPSGEPSREPPTVTDVSPNTAWATNVRLLRRETLGSSDAEPAQSFSTAAAPVLDETIWVDELSALSEGVQETLREAESPAIEVERSADGSLNAFWVAWTAVADFLNSGPDDRHYTIDRTAGTVTFGDGNRGRVPPRGTDSIEIRYRTGGGPDGNVAVDAVAELQDSIQYVDGVTNPAPGTGGAPAESSESVLSRAPERLRDRDRAVAAADYERIATDMARELARARCIPEMNQGGDHEPGWVTLLIVPDAKRPRPTPSTGLKAHVESEVTERAPATLVTADQLVVRGPSYVAASVDTSLVAAGTGSVATLEESVTSAVAAFLDPLTGGENGEGWMFGNLPTTSDLYAVLEGVEGVDHVASLSVTFTSNEGAATVREGEESPSVSADALVHSGSHDVTVRLGEGGADRREAER